MERVEKKYDLDERTALFARNVRDFCLRLPNNEANGVYIPQLIKCSSSPGANYIEANEKLGNKDFKMRIKICLKESKESHYFLDLVVVGDSADFETERLALRQEAKELVLIFSSILKKSGNGD